jgi:Protein of unknown function (DUF2637)
MSDPGFTRPDLCSIRTAGEQEEPAGTVRGRFGADGCPLGDDDLPVPLTKGIDRAIRLSTAAAVLAVAGIAAYVSYWHAYAVVRAHGETGITARLEPATIDGLVYASSMVVLYAARHRVRVPSLARCLLGLGIAATLTANMAQGWSHGPVGAVVAAWPAVSLVGSYELLVWLIRTSGVVERGPSAEHLRDRAACRAANRPRPITAVDGDRPGGTERRASGPTRRPAGQAAGPPAVPASEQCGDEVPEASAVNDAAMAAYRLSVQAGNPLSERRLAQMFGHTSRRWARARIADARQASSLQDSPGAPVMAQGSAGERTRSHDPPVNRRACTARSGLPLQMAVSPLDLHKGSSRACRTTLKRSSIIAVQRQPDPGQPDDQHELQAAPGGRPEQGGRVPGRERPDLEQAHPEHRVGDPGLDDAERPQQGGPARQLGQHPRARPAGRLPAVKLDAVGDVRQSGPFVASSGRTHPPSFPAVAADRGAAAALPPSVPVPAARIGRSHQYLLNHN